MEIPEINLSDLMETAKSTIPDKCRGCGVQCELSTDLGRLMIEKVAIDHFGGHLVGEDGEDFDKFIEANFPDDHVDQAKVDIRNSVASKMNDMDDRITAKQEEIDANARSCNGTLKMRAKRDGVTYTASVCTSAVVYIRGKSKHLPVHVVAE